MRISDWSSDVCSSDLLAEDLIDDTRMIGQEDSLAIAENGQREARSYAIQGANSLSRARSAKKAASGALIKGALDVGSTILGGATQYTSLRQQLTVGGSSAYGISGSGGLDGKCTRLY